MNTVFFKPNGFSQHWFFITKNLLLFSIFGLLLSSCNDTFVDPQPVSGGGPKIESRTTAADTLDYFVKALTKAQADADVRSFIKTAAVNNPWDDNALVYAMEKDVVVKSSLTFAQILYNSRDQSDNRFGSNFFSSDIFVQFPTLSIYLYTGDEDLDLSDFNTSTNTGVFQIPDDHTAIDSITVYRWNTALLTPALATSKIKSTTEPTTQFFCVGSNSLLIAIETDNFTLYPSGISLLDRLNFPPQLELCEDLTDALINNASVELIIDGELVVLYDHQTILDLWCDLCDDGSTFICNDGGGGGDPCEEECDRDCRENRDQLVKYQFNYQSDLDRTCSWTRRWCNFNIIATYAVGPSAPAVANLAKIDKAKRHDLKGWRGRWWTPQGQTLFLKWDLDEHGDPMKYNWIYLNPKAGRERTLSIGLSAKMKLFGVEFTFTGGSSVKYTEKDVLLGEDAVYYCDEADGDGTLYSTGPVDFYIKEQE